jgi:hypothetical protein
VNLKWKKEEKSVVSRQVQENLTYIVLKKEY